MVLGYGLLYGVFFLMSFGLAHGYGESTAEAGLRLALVPVALGLVAPFSHEIGPSSAPAGLASPAWRPACAASGCCG
ncbi:hypothetical protein [Ancylobacter rudongensis]|uniref:hypothetical protein n=1 Tax=Ancylobacter rudongensis TaxID=177413 RepID=UPI000B87E6DA|nr:hypothetical protein [Ancylobacter rudongensis]